MKASQPRNATTVPAILAPKWFINAILIYSVKNLTETQPDGEITKNRLSEQPEALKRYSRTIALINVTGSSGLSLLVSTCTVPIAATASIPATTFPKTG